MSQKRQPEDKKVGSEGNSPEEKRQRVPALKNVILEAMKMNAIQNLFSALEPLIRRVVKEEIEAAFGKHLTSMKKNRENQIDPSKSRTLQLQFINKLSLPVFTGTRIDGEESSVLKVALFDALTGQIVNSDPESLAKVEIVVLEGDFDGCEEDNWTLEEFNSNIVKEREGKRPLLVGNAFLDLNGGIGDMGDLIFTDNSSWTRSRKFRLGARVVGGNFDGIRVREAKTEAFTVKDHRGELYKKHYPPSLLDEVWRLEKIGKDGAFHKRLSGENINTVKDFLTQLHMNSARLRSILGQGMSTKIWEGTVDHAKTCPLSNQMYVYYPSNTQPRTGIVFNIVGQVLGLLGEQQCISIEELSETGKVDAQKLVKVAYEHWEDVVPYEDGAVLRGSLNLPTICFPSSPPEVESSYTIKLSSSQGSSGLYFTHPSSSTPDIPSSFLSIEDTGDIQNYALQGIDNMDLGYDHPLRTPVFNTTIYGSDSMAKTMCGDDHLQYFDHETTLESQNFSLDSPADLGSAISGFFAARSATAIAIHKAKTRWTMIFCVVRWRLIKRIVASKKSGML